MGPLVFVFVLPYKPTISVKSCFSRYIAGGKSARLCSGRVSHILRRINTVDRARVRCCFSSRLYVEDCDWSFRVVDSSIRVFPVPPCES